MPEQDQKDKQIVRDLGTVDKGLGIPKEPKPVIVGSKGRSQEEQPPVGKVVVDALKKVGLSEDNLPPDALRVISDMNEAKDILDKS